MLQDIIDKLSCSLADVLGTGLRGCDFNFENLESLALLPSGTTIPATAAYDRDYIRGLQREGKWIPIVKVYSAAWQTGEDEVETSESKGLEAVTRKGLYKLEVMFRNGLYQQKVLNSLSGNGRWDMILFDEDGNQLHVTTSSGGVRGFSSGRCSVSPIEFKSGTNSMKTKLTIQFTKTSQFNSDIGFIGAGDLPFNPDEIEGVNQARVSFVAPSNAGTTIALKTVLDKDGSTFIGGLDTSQFIVKVAGATLPTPAFVADPTNNSYNITVPALNTGEVVEISMYDTGATRSVIQAGATPDDILYQAKTVSQTVVV